jgi:hypothetical protein
VGTNPNYLGPFCNHFPFNLYRKLPLVNSLSWNQAETVFKIKFWSTTFWTSDSYTSTNQLMSEWICPKRQKKKKARLRYDNVFKTAWTDEFHFIKHSRKGTECTILRPSEKNPFFHGFIILYLKFWLHRFYIQHAAECTILRPSEKKNLGGGWQAHPDALPFLVSRGLACMLCTSLYLIVTCNGLWE